jgi:hypothetical protein
MRQPPKVSLVWLLGIGACLMPNSRAIAESDNGNAVVVSSRVSDSYVRGRLADGTYKTDTYAFGNGGRWTGAVSDPSIDNLSFIEVAQSIVRPLAQQNFVPDRDPKTTRQLIMVYWGRTSTSEPLESSIAAQSLQSASGKMAAAKSANAQQKIQSSTGPTAPVGPMVCGKFDTQISTALVADQVDADNAMAGSLALVAAENRTRDQIDSRNASLLGYDSWWDATSGSMGTTLEHRRQDMLDELEQDRYFVILMAYDFQAMWKQKKHKLLWETRFSIRQRGTVFDKQLTLIAQSASRYFGKDSNGLIHEDIPVGHVDIGTLQSLGPVAER